MSNTDWYWDAITWEEVDAILSHCPHLTFWDLSMRVKRRTNQNNNHNRKFQAERLMWSQTRGPEAGTVQHKDDATGQKAKKLRAKQKKHEKKLLASGAATTTTIDESHAFTAITFYDDLFDNRPGRDKNWYTLSNGTLWQ